jgi:hypothetical protein
LSDATTPPVDRLKRHFQGLCDAHRPGWMIGDMSAERRTRAAPTGAAAHRLHGERT